MSQPRGGGTLRPVSPTFHGAGFRKRPPHAVSTVPCNPFEYLSAPKAGRKRLGCCDRWLQAYIEESQTACSEQVFLEAKRAELLSLFASREGRDSDGQPNRIFCAAALEARFRLAVSGIVENDIVASLFPAVYGRSFAESEHVSLRVGGKILAPPQHGPPPPAGTPPVAMLRANDAFLSRAACGILSPEHEQVSVLIGRQRHLVSRRTGMDAVLQRIFERFWQSTRVLSRATRAWQTQYLRESLLQWRRVVSEELKKRGAQERAVRITQQAERRRLASRSIDMWRRRLKDSRRQNLAAATRRAERRAIVATRALPRLERTLAWSNASLEKEIGENGSLLQRVQKMRRQLANAARLFEGPGALGILREGAALPVVPMDMSTRAGALQLLACVAR
jgi:hypothetical protein